MTVVPSSVAAASTAFTCDCGTDDARDARQAAREVGVGTVVPRWRHETGLTPRAMVFA